MMISPTCGERRASTCSTIGLPRSGCRPLSTPPMRRPNPPARIIPDMPMPETPSMRGILRGKLASMNDRRFLVPFINLGHLLDHLVMLVFPTVVLALGREWNQPYSELLPMALGRGWDRAVLGPPPDGARRLHCLRRLRHSRRLARRSLEPLQDDGGVFLR